MTTLWLTQELTGSILDVGGGGEGIIGRRYGSAVTLRPFPLRGLLLRTSPSFTR